MRITTIIFTSILIFNMTSVLSASGWEQRADFGAEARHRGTGMSIGNKGYMGLGHYNGTGINIVKSDWWEYDPATNSWTQKADYIGNSGNGNYAVLVFSMENSPVGYLGGGQLGSGNEFYKYAPATNTWTAVANIPLGAQNTQGFTIGSNGYYVDGGALWKYDAVANSWSNMGGVPFSLSWWNSAFSINGRGYIKTSFNFWEYKPLTNQWINRASFPGLASGGSAAFTQNGKGYIVGGYVGSLSNVNSEVWEFDPATNQWNLRTEFMGTSRRFASSFNIGNRAFLGTGTNGTNFNDFWEFDVLASFEEKSLSIEVLSYPNPVADKVQFNLDQNINGNLKIFNQYGQLISTLPISNSKAIFNRSTEPSGIYFYNVEVDDKILYTNNLIFL